MPTLRQILEGLDPKTELADIVSHNWTAERLLGHLAKVAPRCLDEEYALSGDRFTSANPNECYLYPPPTFLVVRAGGNGTQRALEPRMHIVQLLEALDYLLEQTVDMDLRHGIELSEGEAKARMQALAAIAEVYKEGSGSSV
jgi:hypothetical protein